MLHNDHNMRGHSARGLLLLAIVTVAGACNSAFFKVSGESAEKAPAEAAAVKPSSPVPDTRPGATLPEYVEPEAVASDSAGVTRLVGLAMLWHTVREHHPWIVSERDASGRDGSARDAWDGAVARIVPAFRAARDADATSAVINTLLTMLGDPITRVETASNEASQSAGVPSAVVTIAPGVRARVRTRDNSAGAAALRFDSLPVAAGIAGSSPRASIAFPAGVGSLAGDTSAYPYLGARVLAAFRVWGIMRDRHAHRDSYDDDVDAVFERTLPRVEAATNREAYAAALRDMVSSFDDSQVRLQQAGTARASTASAGFEARIVEGRALVTALRTGTQTPGLAVGTEITSVDGYPLAAWLLEHRRDVTASNEWTRARDLARLIPRGAAGSLSLKVRDGNGPERAVSTQRVADASADARDTRAIAGRSGMPSRMIGDIAYHDLERLSAEGADSAFAASRTAAATILDLRGGTAVPPMRVLRRFAVQPRFIAARSVRRPVTMSCTVPLVRDARRECADERITEPVIIESDTSGAYRGRLVVLVDERTQDVAERLALALDAGANATLIGTSSAGAAAPTVAVRLPGNLLLHYPDVELRRADGGQLHRVGLTPLVEARATVRGLRAGNDEILDRAVNWLQQLGAPRRRR